MAVEGLTQSVCQSVEYSGMRNAEKTGFCSIREAVGLEIFKGRVAEDTGLYKVVQIP
jgi:hypothetical protein